MQNFEQLLKVKDGKKVNVFIPAFPNQFFAFRTMEADDGSIVLSGKVAGHRPMYCITADTDMSGFFFIETGRVTHESYAMAKIHPSKRNWIYN